MKHTLSSATACAAALALLTGCGGFLKPQPDRTEFYMLAPNVVRANAAARADGDILKAVDAPYKCSCAVGVDRVDFPAYLDNAQLAMRLSPERVQYAPFARWAEPLDSGLTRTLVSNLGIATANPMVVVYPNRMPGFSPDVILYTSVLRFDGKLGGKCALVVRWRLSTGDGKVLLHESTDVLRADAPADFEGYVRALGGLWSDFSDRVAQTLSEMEAAAKIAPQKGA